MKIGITCDIKNDYTNLSKEELAELDTKETVDAIFQSLKNLGYDVEYIGNIFALTKMLAGGKTWDLVFNIAEGLYGSARESQIPALLDAYKIPYTFSDTLTLAVCLNKGVTKKVLKYTNINTPDFWEMTKFTQLDDQHFPVFVKPIAEGTSKGIELCSLITNNNDLKVAVNKLLKKFKQPVLVEEYLPGKEFTVGILDNKAVGVMEINCDSGLYTFEHKQNYKTCVTYNLAEEPYASACSQFSLQVWQALNCQDAGRVDIKYDKHGQPSCIEVNPLAGLNPVDSDLPIMCRISGNLSYQELIGEIVRSALKK